LLPFRYAAVGGVFILVTILVAVYLYKEHVHEKEMEAESNKQAEREGGISVTENPMQQMPIIEEGMMASTESMKIRTQRPSVSPAEAVRMGSVRTQKSPLAGPSRQAPAPPSAAPVVAVPPPAPPAVNDPAAGDENL
jgi:hypothetical protein